MSAISKSAIQQDESPRQSWRRCLERAEEIKARRRSLLIAMPKTLKDLHYCIQNIAELEKVIRVFGGRNLHIVARHSELNQDMLKLQKLISTASFTRIRDYYSGTTVYIPNCHRYFSKLQHKKVLTYYMKLVQEGHSHHSAEQITSSKFKLSERWIRSLVSDSKKSTI